MVKSRRGVSRGNGRSYFLKQRTPGSGKRSTGEPMQGPGGTLDSLPSAFVRSPPSFVLRHSFALRLRLPLAIRRHGAPWLRSPALRARNEDARRRCRRALSFRARARAQ